MTFSSALFIFAFLPLNLLLYYLLPKKCGNIVLLVTSLGFYVAGGEKYIILLAGSILFNYSMGLLLARTQSSLRWQKGLLTVGIVGNLAPLLYYKYLNFGIINLDSLFHLQLPQQSLILPLGISFFTFKALSYLIDIYRCKAPANRNLVQVALYIALFQQVISGPIMPYAAMQSQLGRRTVTAEDFACGIGRFSYGLAKKVLIADILGQTVDTIFTAAQTGQVDQPTAWLGMLCYTLQIFFDFSGYSDMAVGLGKLFGFSIMENFNFPYIAKSISEFWRRWHISLSSWFRDYLYIPMGGNRRGNVYLHLFVVFLVTGIWHGASWTFVLWGVWHGLFITTERLVRKKDWYIKSPALLRWAITIFAVSLGWVLFRSATLPDALLYYRLLFGFVHTANPEFTVLYYCNPQILTTLAVGLILCTPVAGKLFNRVRERAFFRWGRVVFINALLVVGILFVLNSSYSPFIYFQF